MVKYVILIIVPLLFSQCTKEEFPNELSKGILGEWELVAGFKEPCPNTGEPMSERICFKENGKYRIYENDELARKGKFSVLLGDGSYDANKELILHLSEENIMNTESFYLKDTVMILWYDCLHCNSVRTYNKISDGD